MFQRSSAVWSNLYVYHRKSVQSLSWWDLDLNQFHRFSFHPEFLCYTIWVLSMFVFFLNNAFVLLIVLLSYLFFWVFHMSALLIQSNTISKSILSPSLWFFTALLYWKYQILCASSSSESILNIFYTMSYLFL